MTLRAAAFLDRDGVINRRASRDKYVTRRGDFRALPGVVEGIGHLNRAGLSVILGSNRRCVAKGLLTEAESNKLHEQMSGELARALPLMRFTTARTSLSSPAVAGNPHPGMLLDAAGSYGLDLATSWMIGDSDIDI